MLKLHYNHFGEFLHFYILFFHIISIILNKLTWCFAGQNPCFLSTFQIFVCPSSCTIPIIILAIKEKL
jgi:hypothetical protein